jgi:AcrR family transcriptional regulator
MPGHVDTRRNERREREHETARASILSAARKLAAREGAHGLTLRGVAAEAGYAPAALYGYFRSRTDLVLALAAEDLGHLARAMRDVVKGQAREGKLALAASTAFAHLCNAETLAAAAALDGSPESLEAIRLFNGRLISALLALSDAAGARAESRDGQRDVVLIAGALAGLALLSRSGRLDALGFTSEELLARLDRRFSVS